MATPLNQLLMRDRHDRAGASYAPFAGWEMPLQYEGIVAEHRAVRASAGVFDVSHLGRVMLEGDGATAALRGVSTYDCTTIERGTAHYSLYCTEDGGIADDIFLYRFGENIGPESWLVIQNAANHDEGLARLRAAHPSARDITDETVLLAVQGPDALAALISIFPEVAGLENHHHIMPSLQDEPVTIARTGYTGEDGAELIAAVEPARELWDRLLAAGVTPCGLGARDTLRLEAALPLHGHDISPSTHPYEAGLGWAVTLDDGTDFTGRAALEKLKAAPRIRRLAHLATPGRAVLREGYPVLDPNNEGTPVSELSSGTFSPTLGTGIGMAYLPADLAKRGTELSVEVRGKPVAVTVVKRPFYTRSTG